MTDEKRLAEARKVREGAWDKARNRSLGRGVEHHELIKALDEDIAAALSARDAEIAAKDAEIERLKADLVEAHKLRHDQLSRAIAQRDEAEAELARLRVQPAADDVGWALTLWGEITRDFLLGYSTRLPIRELCCHIAYHAKKRFDTAARQDARRQALEDAGEVISNRYAELDGDGETIITRRQELATIERRIEALADKPATPDIISLVRALRRAVESTSVGDPLKIPEWRALCAAMNEIDKQKDRALVAIDTLCPSPAPE